MASRPLTGATITVYPSPSAKQIRRVRVGQSFSVRPVFRGAITPSGAYAATSGWVSPNAREYRVRIDRAGFLPAVRYLSGRQLAGQLRTGSVQLQAAPSASGQFGPRVAIGPWDKLTYTLDAQRKRNTAVGKALSRTKRAKVDFVFSASGSMSIGVAVRLDYEGMVAFDTSAQRTMTTGAEIPFFPLRGAGRKKLRTSILYKKWTLDEITTTCPIRVGCRKHHKKWTEIRPEEINGGDGSVTSRRLPPPPPRAVWCGARIRKGYGNTIVRGQADTNTAAVSVFGVELSSQAGYDREVRVTFDARKRDKPIRICGYSGAAMSDAGSAVAMPYR